MLSVLLTGAAGLIGGEVAARLVAAGHRVTALVHRERSVRANDGSTVEGAEIVAGDVSAPRLGWDDTMFAAMAARHDLLIHCAAATRFDLDEETYRAVNVGGTRRAIQLAEAGEMALLHVSTAYVCGERSGLIREDEPLPNDGFANGYEATKAEAEALVRQSALRWIVARPSIVVGHSRSGAIRRFDAIYGVFKLLADGQVRQLPARADATLDIVPIDYVAEAIVTLAEFADQACGGTFHLVSAQPLPVTDLIATIDEYPQCSTPELLAPERFDLDVLSPRERRLYGRVAGLYASYLQRNPHFDDRGLRALSGLACPPTGLPYIRRLIDYCIRSGFIDAGVSERPDSDAQAVSALRRPTKCRP